MLSGYITNPIQSEGIKAKLGCLNKNTRPISPNRFESWELWVTMGAHFSGSKPWD